MSAALQTILDRLDDAPRPPRVLVALVQKADPDTQAPIGRQQLVGVYTTVERALQECTTLHARITGRASLRWVHDDDDVPVRYGWIGTDRSSAEWRYSVLNLAQYGGTP